LSLLLLSLLFLSLSRSCLPPLLGVAASLSKVERGDLSAVPLVLLLRALSKSLNSSLDVALYCFLNSASRSVLI
jgi:hypothetical protein